MPQADLMELREKQQNQISQAREKLDQITDDMDASRAQELETQADQHMEEARKVEAQAERIHKLQEAEERVSGFAHSRAPEQGKKESQADSEERSFRDIFKTYLSRGREGLSAEEDRVLRETRAQSVGTDSAGGYTVASEFFDELVISMKAFGPMLDAGVVRQIQTATGATLNWPTMDDTSNKGRRIAENTQANEANLGFGQKQLDAYKYTSDIFRLSAEIMQDSALNIEQIVRDAMAERIGRIANEELTVGTGSGMPNGIVTASTLGKSASATASLDADELLDMFHSVDPAYRQQGGTWMFNDTTFKEIRKLKDGQNNYLWQAPDLRTGEPGQFLGVDYRINQDMPDVATGEKPIIYGNFQRYILRMVREFAIRRLVERYADSDQVGFVGFSRMDGELIDTAAVKHMVMA